MYAKHARMHDCKIIDHDVYRASVTFCQIGRLPDWQTGRDAACTLLSKRCGRYQRSSVPFESDANNAVSLARATAMTDHGCPVLPVSAHGTQELVPHKAVEARSSCAASCTLLYHLRTQLQSTQASKSKQETDKRPAKHNFRVLSGIYQLCSSCTATRRLSGGEPRHS